MMPTQRARAGESRVGNRFSNGPPRAQRKYCDVRHTSVVRDMKVSHECTGRTVNQGGTADIVVIIIRP